MASTHYDTLKVVRDAPPEVIRAAYKALSQQHHPDKNPHDSTAASVMQALNASYEVLSDPARRQEYDRLLDQQGIMQDISTTLKRASAELNKEPVSAPRDRSERAALHLIGYWWFYLLVCLIIYVVPKSLAPSSSPVSSSPRHESYIAQPPSGDIVPATYPDAPAS